MKLNNLTNIANSERVSELNRGIIKKLQNNLKTIILLLEVS